MLVEHERVRRLTGGRGQFEAATWRWRKLAHVRMPGGRERKLGLEELTGAHTVARRTREREILPPWGVLLLLQIAGQVQTSPPPDERRIAEFCRPLRVGKGKQKPSLLAGEYMQILALAADIYGDTIAELARKNELRLPWGEGEPRVPANAEEFERIGRMLRDFDPDRERGVARILSTAALPETPGREASGTEVSVGNRTDQPAAGAPKPVAALPPRRWSLQHCPNCGRPGVDFISFSEFSRRWQESRGKAPRYDVISTRARSGRYCADASWHIPWCSVCKEKTPEGQGAEEVALDASASDYELTAEDQENGMTWAESAVQERDPRFDRGLLESDVLGSRSSSELFQVAATKIMEALQKSRGKLTRDQAEDIGKRAIQDHLNSDFKSRMLESGRKLNLSDRPDDDNGDT